MKQLLGRSRRGEKGASATEYIIILVLVAVALIFTWQRFGSVIQQKLGTAQNQVNDTLVPAT